MSRQDEWMADFADMLRAIDEFAAAGESYGAGLSTRKG